MTDAGSPDTPGAACTGVPVSGMGILQDFCPPTAPGGGGILFSASGEVLALGGYRFPPASPDDVAFVDGWDIRYDRVLTTFDHITLSSGPDKSMSDPSQCDDGHGASITCGTGGSVVAEVDGPFAVDLHKGGPLAGAGGQRRAGGRNAQNPANDPAAPFGNEEHQRGIAIVANQATIAQLTFHLDHVFWDSVVHDSPAHFDTFASRLAGVTTPTTITLEDYKGYKFAPFVDAQGHPLPWRSCLASYPLPTTSAAISLDTQGIPVDPAGDPATALRDFYDDTLYNHSTFGHLNSDGLSVVDRQYPSPR